MHMISGNKNASDAFSFAFQLVPDDEVEGVINAL